MHTIEGIVKEEYERQKRLLKEWTEQKLSLPKGSVSIKSIKEHRYAYLNEWKDGKAVSRYLGPEGCETAIIFQEKILKRKELEKKISNIKALLLNIEKGIRVT